MFDQIRNNIRQYIIVQLTADLTIGRLDNNEQPYSQENIDEYIENNENKIQDIIDAIIQEFEDEDLIDELESGINMELIREFLYEHINPFDYIDEVVDNN